MYLVVFLHVVNFENLVTDLHRWLHLAVGHLLPVINLLPTQTTCPVIGGTGAGDRCHLNILVVTASLFKVVATRTVVTTARAFVGKRQLTANRL